MNLYIIPGALAVTLLVMFVTSLFSKRPLRGLWVFILIVWLAVWASQLWISPIEPRLWGVSWLPMFLVAFVVWFLILALIPPIRTPQAADGVENEKGPAFVLGIFFWIVLVLLILAVIGGYYHMAHLEQPGDTAF